jgi:hypothetical protein
MSHCSNVRLPQLLMANKREENKNTSLSTVGKVNMVLGNLKTCTEVSDCITDFAKFVFKLSLGFTAN